MLPSSGEGDPVDLRLRVEAGAGPVLPSLVGRKAKSVRKSRGRSEVPGDLRGGVMLKIKVSLVCGGPCA